MSAPTERPPSVDQLARSIADTGLPHPLLVDAARAAIAAGEPDAARHHAEVTARTLLQPVVNATGVLLHTNLGRAPLATTTPGRASNLEFDLEDGVRGSRTGHAGRLFARAVGAEAAVAVNNCAAAVLLALAALARGRGVAVSRGELVEIGGGFRVPDVMAQSGARLVEVGTTNRTRLADYRSAVDADDDLALLLKVHRSNYTITGFTEETSVSSLATLGPPVVVDLGSGLLDAACPWLDGGPPSWLHDEPAAAQTLGAGAGLVVFSGDKLLGGPQAGIIAGDAELVRACARHPLYRAFRPGGLVLSALQDVALAYLDRSAGQLPFWRMATTPSDELRRRAEAITASLGAVPTAEPAGPEVVECASVTGGGTLPGVEIPSVGVSLAGDHAAELRAHAPPVIARVDAGRTVLDLRTVEPDDDHVVADALRRLDLDAVLADRSLMHVVATAGHVDHGKSTLVLHLTGTDPDRLAEEKARGLTIDLGFAGAELPSGRRMAIIDVPGHVRFLKNMLAGLGAVDACLFVVAATEGWKPQSEEHLRILDVLGVRHGIVALTKVGLVDDDLRELAVLEVEEAVTGTFLEGAPVVPVDAPAGTGLDELRRSLDELLAETPTAVDHGRPRLWIDRSFAPPGAGTVVTGTLAGGSVAVDDELVVEPRRLRVRVRGIQRLHEQVDRLGPGNRTALNLVGVGHEQLGRGHVLIREGQWHRTDMVDVALTVLDGIEHEVSRRGAYLAYLGSGEHPVRLRVLGPDPLLPGDTGPVRLHLPGPLPLVPGDRFVLRDAGRGETIGGGEILDVDPVLPASRAAPDRSVERVVTERGWVDASTLELVTGQRLEPTLGRWVVAPEALEAARDRVRSLLTEAGPLGLDLAGLDERDRAVAAGLDDVVVEAGRVVDADSVDPLDGHPWLSDLEAEPFTPPPPPDDLGRNEIRELVRRGQVVEEDGVAFGAGAVERACSELRTLLGEHPDGVTVAQIRDHLGTTRKYVLPLLAHLDATGRTRRRGDLRIAGPRL